MSEEKVRGVFGSQWTTDGELIFSGLRCLGPVPRIRPYTLQSSQCKHHHCIFPFRILIMQLFIQKPLKCWSLRIMKAKIYSRLDSIKEATKNYTLKGTPADLTGVMQQVNWIRRSSVSPFVILKKFDVSWIRFSVDRNWLVGCLLVLISAGWDVCVQRKRTAVRVERRRHRRSRTLGWCPRHLSPSSGCLTFY